MAETVCAEIIYYRERAGLAREKADAATVPETKKNHLAEGGAVARSGAQPPTARQAFADPWRQSA
jgi:hypothetical protein